MLSGIETDMKLKITDNSIRSLYTIILFILLFSTKMSYGQKRENSLIIGSKKFTESVILGEIASLLLQSSGFSTRHRDQLGGTRILFNALLNGEIDIYPEYTGTIMQEILAGKNLSEENDIREELSSQGILMSEPIGFNNTYVIGMKRSVAESLNIETISDLRKHPQLKFGFSNEFMSRGDGWPSLRIRYALPQSDVRGVDHDIGYRALESGSIDVIDLYATDAEIDYYNLNSLKDDLLYFPEYYSVFLYRKELLESAPEAINALLSLEGAITEAEMVFMNASVKIKGESEGMVAANFLNNKFGMQTNFKEITIMESIIKNSYEHLYLVLISLIGAIIIAIPLGILAYKKEKIGQIVLGVVSVIQTIPSLALIVFMIPLLGIGAKPAIAALFLYSLLPIVRNTYSGLKDVPLPLQESAQALGLPAGIRMKKIELPLASRSILSGIKTSAVINVGTATLGAIIGAGGFGQPILTGIRLDNTGLILQGAIPAALLAFAVQWLFELVEPFFVSEGLRLKD